MISSRTPEIWNDGDLAEVADEDNVRPLDDTYDMGIEKSVPVYDNNLKMAFRVPCGAKVMVISHPSRTTSRYSRSAIFVQVLVNGTNVWIRSVSLKRVTC